MICKNICRKLNTDGPKPCLHLNPLETLCSCVPSNSPALVPIGAAGLQVGRALRKHLSTFSEEEKAVVPDQGMEFCDFDNDSSDSGLETII